MGGISDSLSGGATGLGLSAYSLLNSGKTAKRKEASLEANRQKTTENRKNLLEQQLASRRAALGAMGISSSPSAMAAQSRRVKDTYNTISNDEAEYKSKIDQLNQDKTENYYNKMFTEIIPGTTKLIK